MQTKLLWGHCTWEEIRDAAEAGAIAVVPFGSTEQHGPILPVDTDIHIAEKAALDGARVASERLGVRCLVLPTMPFGLATHHMNFPGTITLSPQTYVAVIAEVLRCVARHGFRRIAVLTGHGGNRPAIELAMAEIARERADGPDGSIRIALFRDHGDEVFSRRSREALAGEKPEGRPGIHAARWETAETLADRPELVRRDRIDADRPPEMPVGVPEWTWLTHEIAPTGATGDPSVATAEFGCKAWAAWAEAFASFLKRLAEAPL